jgi:drug/metabolite transporter (DMT)-like permease
MVLGSAASFGTLPVLVKYAYATGSTPLQTLAFRFLLAALGLHALAFLRGEHVFQVRARRMAQFLLLGGAGYAAQSAAFFGALCCLPASLVELIAYAYPSLVTVGAWLVFRRPIGGRRALALAVSFGGVALLIGGVQLQAGPPLVLALAAPVLYAAYILAGERLMRGSSALTASALVHTGAGISLFAALLLLGQPPLPRNPSSWPFLLLLALIPSMIAISLFLAGLPRVGAPQASLLSTVEPVVTLGLAVALLGDRLSPAQLAGAAAVILSVIIVQVGFEKEAARPIT